MRANIFGSIDKNGTFLQFQNYADDLCKQLANYEGWRVVPTKFMLLDIPKTILSGKEFDNALKNNEMFKMDTIKATQTSINKSTTIPQILQSYFESNVAICKDNIDKFETTDEQTKKEFGNEEIKFLFWQAVERYGIIGLPYPQAKTDTNYYDGVKFIGDINVISSKDYDGVTNTELYIYVPEDAVDTKYGFYTSTQKPLYLNYTENVSESDDLYGWSENDYPANSTLERKSYFSSNNILGEEGKYINLYEYTTTMPDFDMDSENYVYNNAIEKHQNELSSFKFNSILLFYDIEYNVDGKIIKKHIGMPMGIYFMGTPNSVGVFSNSIKKFESNGDINSQGTAYSLRLCQKFMALPNVNKVTVNTEVSNDNLDDYTSVMAEFGKGQKLMNEILKNEKNLKDYIDNEIVNFRNYRTNVPYIKKVGDKYEWFVNGRDLGQATLDEETIDKLLLLIKDNKEKELVESCKCDKSEVDSLKQIIKEQQKRIDELNLLVDHITKYNYYGNYYGINDVDYSSDINSLNEKYSTLESHISSVSKGLSDLKDTVTQLSYNFNGMSTNLNERITALENK